MLIAHRASYLHALSRFPPFFPSLHTAFPGPKAAVMRFMHSRTETRMIVGLACVFFGGIPAFSLYPWRVVSAARAFSKLRKAVTLSRLSAPLTRLGQIAIYLGSTSSTY